MAYSTWAGSMIPRPVTPPSTEVVPAPSPTAVRTREIMLSTEYQHVGESGMEAALTYNAFVVQGALSARSADSIYVSTRVGYVAAFAEYAYYIEALAKAADTEGLEWSGVFEYELCESFGLWVARYITTNGGFPPRIEACCCLVDLMTDYFLAANPQYSREELRALFSAV